MLLSPLPAHRPKALASLFTAVAATVLFVGPASHSHADACAPQTFSPSPSGGYASAVAYFPCGGTYNVGLYNNAGTLLGSNGSQCSSACYGSTGSIRCAGAIVHTAAWVNVNGKVQSNRSPDPGGVQC